MAKDCNGNKIKVGSEASILPIKADVIHIDSARGVLLRGVECWLPPHCLQLDTKETMPEKVRELHPHAEVAKAWLDGYPIEILNQSGWVPYCRASNQGYVPSFNPKMEFRIQPVESEKDKQIKELVRQAEELLAKAKELEATK